ncbi:MAG: hypothetical protein M3Z05_22395 [Gemmatimonadota bacterium]|nr:hypothetical protein [Gemmatimonadota bacterium]
MSDNPDAPPGSELATTVGNNPIHSQSGRRRYFPWRSVSAHLLFHTHFLTLNNDELARKSLTYAEALIIALRVILSMLQFKSPVFPVPSRT